MVGQPYDLDASKEYVIRGNSALIKCQFPSFMSDFLHVESWTIDDTIVAIYSDSLGTYTYICPVSSLIASFNHYSNKRIDS